MSGMYDMYPEYGDNSGLTLRASAAEMQRWDSYTLDDGLAGDTVDMQEARQVATAQRAVDQAERPLGFQAVQQFAARTVRAAGVELG